MSHHRAAWIVAAIVAPLCLVAAPHLVDAQPQPQTKPAPKPKAPGATKGGNPKAGPQLDALPPSQIGIGTLAKFAYLLDAGTDTVLLFKDADKPMLPSSMAKLMTIYIVFEELKAGRLKPDTKFRVSERARNMGGSRMFVEINSEISVEDLIKGVVVLSGNDACIVLAEGLSGTEETFAARMTKRGRDLGLTGSLFKNSSGWPEPGMVVTARDLAILAKRTVEDFPEHYRYYAQADFTWNNIRQENRNRLLAMTPGTDGLKTGHTEEAGYGLAASTIRDGRRLILVVNGLPDMRTRAAESARLIEWGFREYSNRIAFRAGETVALADVWLGDSGKVPLVATRPVGATVPVGQDAGVRVKVEYQGPVRAPVRKGDPIGKAIVQASASAPPVEIPLYAGADVPRLGPLGRAFGVIRHYLFGWILLTAMADRGGKFITLEGGEGAGKSTHIQALAERLRAQGIDVATTREPGGSPGAEMIRKLLVEGPADAWDGPTEALLMFAARRDHLVRTIWPALRRGQWVISDRFADSTRAYQGYGHGFDLAQVETLYRLAVGDFRPDVTIILDLAVEVGLARTQARQGAETRYERLGAAFHQRVRDGFLRIAAAEPARCVIIDADAPIDTVRQRVWLAVTDRLGLE